MPDFVIVPNANDAGVFTGASFYSGVAPLTASGLTNGTAYRAYVLSAASDAFTPEAAAPADPTVFFTTVATGPYFVDPANVPANTTRIRHRITFRVPASAEGDPASTMLLGQESQGFDVLLRTNGTSPEVFLNKIEDGDTAAVTPADGTIWTGAYDDWVTLEVDADQGAGKFRFSVDGGTTTERDLGTGDGVFQSNREISYLANTAGNTQVPAGVSVALIESFFTTSGTETLRKRIEGNAATVNADGWKAGGDAT